MKHCKRCHDAISTGHSIEVDGYFYHKLCARSSSAMTELDKTDPCEYLKPTMNRTITRTFEFDCYDLVVLLTKLYPEEPLTGIEVTQIELDESSQIVKVVLTDG